MVCRFQGNTRKYRKHHTCLIIPEKDQRPKAQRPTPPRGRGGWGTRPRMPLQRTLRPVGRIQSAAEPPANQPFGSRLWNVSVGPCPPCKHIPSHRRWMRRAAALLRCAPRRATTPRHARCTVSPASSRRRRSAASKSRARCSAACSARCRPAARQRAWRTCRGGGVADRNVAEPEGWS